MVYSSVVSDIPDIRHGWYLRKLPAALELGSDSKLVNRDVKIGNGMFF